MKEKLTIVGPLNTSENNSDLFKHSNLDAIFLMAKYNKKFKESFLTDKEKAIKDNGFNLTKSEKFVINNIEKNKLKSIIEYFKIPGITKKTLSNWRSATAVLLLVSSLTMTTEGCRSSRHQHSRGLSILELVPDKKTLIDAISINTDKK